MGADLAAREIALQARGTLGTALSRGKDFSAAIREVAYFAGRSTTRTGLLRESVRIKRNSQPPLKNALSPSRTPVLRVSGLVQNREDSALEGFQR
jgi:hypothetical protein